MLSAADGGDRKVIAVENLSEANLFLLKMKPALMESLQNGTRYSKNSTLTRKFAHVHLFL
jgi:hypothetical protein